MANVLKCVLATEASNDSLLVIMNKALMYPKIGTHVGGGLHVVMPPAYDGLGACPPGWTKQAADNWVNTAIDAALPMSDELATELQ
ncbi:MAG TPA: hypothetical protein VFL17_08655, partial [Anaerolineae bacterium]|nr:hypothetical protein [Anaerolineae bacterium]